MPIIPPNSVYKFDVYISEFEQKLNEIGKENGGDTILVNASSGDESGTHRGASFRPTCGYLHVDYAKARRRV